MITFLDVSRRRTALIGAAVLGLCPALGAQDRPALPQGQDPNEWQAYYHQGFEFMRTRPDKAGIYFAYAARLEPGVAELYVARAAAWWRSHPAQWEMWVQDDPLVRGDSGIRVAQQWLDHAYLINPFVQPNMMALAAPGWTRDPPDSPYWRGFADYVEGHWQSADREFSRHLQRHPDDWAAYYWRSLVNVQLQRFDSAGRDLQTLLDSISRFEGTHTLHGDLGSADIHYTLGLVRLRAGDRAGAKAALEQTFLRDLAFYMGHQYYGNLLMEEGDAAGAIREYALAVDLQPEDEVLHFNYGTILLQVGRADSAVAQLSAAIRLNPEYAAPYFNCGLALERAGRANDARLMFEDFIVRAPQRLSEQIALARARIGGR